MVGASHLCIAFQGPASARRSTSETKSPVLPRHLSFKEINGLCLMQFADGAFQEALASLNLSAQILQKIGGIKETEWPALHIISSLFFSRSTKISSPPHVKALVIQLRGAEEHQRCTLHLHIALAKHFWSFARLHHDGILSLQETS